MQKGPIVFVFDDLNHSGFVENETRRGDNLFFSVEFDREPVIAPLDDVDELVSVVGFHMDDK